MREGEKKKGLSRRDFIRAGLVGAAALTTEGVFHPLSSGMELEAGGRQVSRTTGRERRTVPSTCLGCFARCGLFGYVEDGHVMKLGGNPDHPNSRGRLCAKGQAGLNLLYDPERVLHPLRRVGARGKGEFEQISWEDALNEVAERLRELRAEGRPEQLVFHSERDITTADLTRRFTHAVGSPNCLNFRPLAGVNKQLAHELTWGAELDIDDVAYTQYIVNFGSNPYEAHLLRTSFAQRLQEGRSARFFDGRVHSRAKLVTLDVRVSNTAGRSDEWHPIRPGTDGLVALAMAHVIMEAGLHDERFLAEWTNYPVDELRQHLSQFTLEVAARESGMHAADIKRIALEFATTRPSTTISTGGSTKHWNGVQNERCIALLNAVAGNVDIKGGYCLPRQYRLRPFGTEPPAPTVESELLRPAEFPLVSRGVSERLLPMVAEGRHQLGVYMLYRANPAYAAPESESVAETLRDEAKVPFTVSIDTHISETGQLADLILPSATYLERWEIETPPAFEMVPLISLRQPLVSPRGECRGITEILTDLARRVGGGVEQHFDFASPRAYLRRLIDSLPRLVAAGGLDYLQERGFWVDPEAGAQYESYVGRGFDTPSGKFEIYSERLAAAGFSPLPTYAPIPAHQDLSDGELVLTTFQFNVHTHWLTGNQMWLSEVVHDNPLWINTVTARRLGIEQGDHVRVTSRAGQFETRAWVTEGVHPQVVAVGDGCGHWGYGHVAQAKPFRSQEPQTALVWWGKGGEHAAGPGVSPNRAVLASNDPIGGGQAWMDTVVRVERV
jgi:anaerobic selenocysteine-containing dehydrogenase